MDFQVNKFTVINNFKRLNEFEDFMKWGSPQTYEKFIGEMNGEKVQGFICLSDDNIYKLEKI